MVTSARETEKQRGRKEGDRKACGEKSPDFLVRGNGVAGEGQGTD